MPTTWLSEWRIVGRTFHASSEAVPRWLLARTAPGASLAATQAVLAALRREVHREGLVHHQLPHPGRAAARAGLQQRRQRELLTWRTVKMIYVGAVHNFWAAEVTGKSHRVALPPRPQQRAGVAADGAVGWGEGGSCRGRGGWLRETSQSVADICGLSARGGVWPSGQAVAELCAALCSQPSS